MRLYDRRKQIDGGVGGLPLGYKLSEINQIPAGEGHYDEIVGRELFVVGYYGDNGRARHGMTQFNRWRQDFDRAIGKARAVSNHTPVLMEGGLQRLHGLRSDRGRAFCELLTVVVLRRDLSACRKDSAHLPGAQWDAHLQRVNRAIDALESCGASVVLCDDRESAFDEVRRIVDAPSPSPEFDLAEDASWR